MREPKQNYYLALLLLTALLIFFINLDSLYVNIMEARNFISAREMLHHNNWLLTTLDELPRYQKPPLPTWLTALSASIFGLESLSALRIPAALSTVLLLVFFYKLGPRLRLSKKQSFLSALILASSFYLVFSGRNGQWDIFAHAFMMLTIYYLWAFFQKDQNRYTNAIIAAFFFGFSFMSKGPVSPYALLLPFLLAYAIIYKFRNFGKKWLPLLIFGLVAGTVSCWWFIYVRLADPVSFTEIAAKETENWSNYNIRPFYYYWSFFTQSGIWTIPSFVALLYPYLKNKVANRRAYQFSLLWTLLSVLLLSVIPEKKSRYLLPVLIPMAMNTGFYVEYLFRCFKNMPKKEAWVVYFNHGLIATIGIAFPFAGYFILKLSGPYWFWFAATSICLFSIGIATFIFLKKKNYPPVFYLTVSFIAVIIVFGFPLINTLIENTKFNSIANLQSIREKENIPVYEYKTFTPELIWEYGGSIPLLENKKELQNVKEERFGLLITQEDSTQLKPLKTRYELKKYARFDINQVNPSKSGYKDRLIRDFYILKKK